MGLERWRSRGPHYFARERARSGAAALRLQPAPPDDPWPETTAMPPVPRPGGRPGPTACPRRLRTSTSWICSNWPAPRRRQLWLVPLHQQPRLVEQLWPVVPEGRVRSSHEACRLIRTLRMRLVKAGIRWTVNTAWQALQGPHRKTMQPVHRYAVMGMENSRRLQRSGCRTTQTGAGRSNRPSDDASGAVLGTTKVLPRAIQGILRPWRASF